jgi:hypothetical protein
MPPSSTKAKEIKRSSYRRQAHRVDFGRRGLLADDVPPWCERFRVVGRIAGSDEG